MRSARRGSAYLFSRLLAQRGEICHSVTMDQGPAAFRLLRDQPGEADALTGAIVYECLKDDFGAANQDSRRTGARHLAVTFDPAGGYPFFTVRKSDLAPNP